MPLGATLGCVRTTCLEETPDARAYGSLVASKEEPFGVSPMPSTALCAGLPTPVRSDRRSPELSERFATLCNFGANPVVKRTPQPDAHSFTPESQDAPYALAAEERVSGFRCNRNDASEPRF